MSEFPEEPSSAPALPPPTSSTAPPPDPSPPPPPRFDPTRTIGIIKRKALIKDLAAAYHAECLAYCQELLELQRKCEENALCRCKSFNRLKERNNEAPQTKQKVPLAT
ncbi:hypothetical protein HanPI659440_Chr17g0698021 [Helianthus annuus]|nr:hypothetical protein HanPI659440_Chr17g0698021 [Helianthus annuus]